MRHARAARLTGLLGLLGGLSCNAQEPAEHDNRAAETPEVADAAELAERWRASPIFRSGSRLRARVASGGGGADAFEGFYDSELHAPCGFALADDGQYRCLPEIADGRIRFLDAACTQPIYEPLGNEESDGCGSSMGTFMTDWAGPDLTCSEAYRRRVFRVGKSLAPAMAYGLGPSGCAQQSVMRCPHELESLPPEMFTRGQFVVEPADHDISIDWLEYDDGARVIGRLRDSVREANCHPMPTLFADRCIPSAQAHVFGDIFSGEGCTGSNVALDFSREPCTSSSVVLAWEMDECQEYSRVKAFKLGSALSKAFVSTEGRCEQHAAAVDQSFYAVGEPLAAAELPPLRRALGGTARLAVRYYASADGRPLIYDDDVFYDNELDRPCHPEPFADGTQRCVPQWKQIGDIGHAGPFADPDCKQRVVPLLPEVVGCGREPEFVRLHSALPDLKVSDLFEVGVRLPIDSLTLFYRDGKACKGFSPDPSNNYHAIGKRLELAIIKQSVE